MQAASQRATQAFYEMVEGILSCKERDARLAESDARAASIHQNEIPGRRVRATPSRE